jgi:hypothetical protein
MRTQETRVGQNIQKRFGASADEHKVIEREKNTEKKFLLVPGRIGRLHSDRQETQKRKQKVFSQPTEFPLLSTKETFFIRIKDQASGLACGTLVHRSLRAT